MLTFPPLFSLFSLGGSRPTSSPLLFSESGSLFLSDGILERSAPISTPVSSVLERKRETRRELIFFLPRPPSHLPVQSQKLRMTNGTAYPTAALLTADYQLNEALFNELGVPRLSAQVMWNYFFSYVAYIGAFVSLALFQGPLLWKTAKSQYRGEKLHRDRVSASSLVLHVFLHSN